PSPAVNPLSPPRAPVIFLLASYTAVNIDQLRVLGLLLFLAAYTAVNETETVGLAAVIFLAAYTAVN
ncbi:hypothetical protein, partial [Pseudomonas aeruginosa]|uniref:hypothetical protein n=1 Tax=Pseudomonas aeruginosa TaxID=287 RepID=UPI001C7D61CF